MGISNELLNAVIQMGTYHYSSKIDYIQHNQFYKFTVMYPLIRRATKGDNSMFAKHHEF